MRLPDEGSGMKRDSEVLLMRRERAKGRTQEQAAARAQEIARNGLRVIIVEEDDRWAER